MSSGNSSQRFSFEQVLAAHLDGFLEGLDVAMPGRIETYDPVTQSATVQPLIKKGRTEGDERLVESYPAIPDVPVVFVGSGEFSITWPIKKGDTVILIVASRSLDRWLHGGGEVDPLDDRRMDITDAIAIPGLRSFNRALVAGKRSTTDLVISSGGLIKAGGNSPLVTKEEFESHVHTTPGGLAAGPTTTPVDPITGTTKLRG